jgi:hypothetical protein
MRDFKIYNTKHNDNTMSISLDFFEPIQVGLRASSHFTGIDILGFTKEELEYMASELKRIADSMEG